jgi:hypothetical protein
MKILLTLILVFSTASAFGELPSYLDDYPNVRPSWSGSWYNPDQSGHGINVEFLDEKRTVIYWYTYDLDGNPLWLAALGSNSQVSLAPGGDLGPGPQGIRVEATAYYHEGMMYGEFDPATNDKQKWGTIVLVFPYDRCDYAHMEWYPVMEGFSQGSVALERLTAPSGLDCAQKQDTAGDWEVQFGFDAEYKHQVDIVATPNQEIPHLPFLTFAFFDETDCLWSGQVHRAFGLRADWGSQCGTTATEHAGPGLHFYEYKLCDSENECVRKDEVMIFRDEEGYLIFSR